MEIRLRDKNAKPTKKTYEAKLVQFRKFNPLVFAMHNSIEGGKRVLSEISSGSMIEDGELNEEDLDIMQRAQLKMIRIGKEKVFKRLEKYAGGTPLNTIPDGEPIYQFPD